MPGTAALRDVELVSVGTWAASTGVTTITRADLEAMLAAAGDNVVDRAPVKLGHDSSLNRELGDGEPAYGWVVPKRIVRNAAGKDTLIGDLVGMPAQLAAVAPTAYRRRSVEIAWGVKVGAKTYAAALTAVALLGVTKPAVKGLADVLALYSATPLEADRTGELEVVDGLEDNAVAVAMLAAARHAGASFAQLEALASSAGARDTAVVPAPSADDGETPSEPQPPAPTGAPAMPTPPAPRTRTDDELRTALGLEADADVDAALAALAATAGGNGDGNGDGQPAPETPAPGEPASPAQPTGPAPAGVPNPIPGIPAPDNVPTQPDGQLVGAGAPVQLSAGNYAELTQLAEWARTERRSRVLDEAVRTGRIAPAERGFLTSELAGTPGAQPSGFAAALERDEEGTTTLIAGLAPRFAVSELGAADAPTTGADTAADKAFDDFVGATFPDLAQQ